ncbi:39S ribosomal protein L38, mitochondrial [Intoshia linei]|uniref:39S ribosomal protein L38, mitochondrial n=1 Tax=Intoshia linei TaxID=1819745 RepID=A0A177BAZ9_9BILA|nr:39S ribosomal protein L38, mitochondrial [Intoshia linei]
MIKSLFNKNFVRGSIQPPKWVKNVKKDKKYYKRIDYGIPVINDYEHTEMLEFNKKMKERLLKNEKLGNCIGPNQSNFKNRKCIDYFSMAKLHNIYKDLFNNDFFYNLEDFVPYFRVNDDKYPVYYGNIIPCNLTTKQPTVDIKPNQIVQIVSPDGNIFQGGEYLHSLVSDKTIHVSYIPPFPARGFGFCRYVLLLYEYNEKSDISGYVDEFVSKEPKSRKFISHHFINNVKGLKPIALSFFQSQHDSSVKNVYYNILDTKQPIFKYQGDINYVEQINPYEFGVAFDEYLDQYQSKEDLDERIFKEKMSEISPFYSDYVKNPLKYPLVHKLKESGSSWLKTKRQHQINGTSDLVTSVSIILET